MHGNNQLTRFQAVRNGKLCVWVYFRNGRYFSKSSVRYVKDGNTRKPPDF